MAYYIICEQPLSGPGQTGHLGTQRPSGGMGKGTVSGPAIGMDV